MHWLEWDKDSGTTHSGNGHSEIKRNAYADSGRAYARTAGDRCRERRCSREVVLERGGTGERRCWREAVLERGGAGERRC